MNLNEIFNLFCFRYHIILSFLCSVVIGFQAVGQQVCTQIDIGYYEVPDSIIVLPSSILIEDREGTNFVFKDGKLFLLDTLTLPTTLCFQYIRKSWTLVESSIVTELYDSGVIFTNKAIPEAVGKNTQELLGIDGIEIEGAFLRSVSGGQDNGAYMHSALDLHISGKISEELSLDAKLTDQQVPFEPEGNTQRLQDFDRVNIQLRHKNWQVEGGDIIARALPDNRFLKFQRQVQGVRISTDRLTFDSLNAESSLLTAISRSKNAVQLIDPVEGVLGPYRLEGPQGEKFIFIIAGTENVFLEGQLLERGIDKDYVIDYNAAEITFNPSIYVAKYSQIQVAFDYSDQQFSRSLLNLAHQQQLGKLKISTNIYQEADNINKPFEELSPAEIQALAGAEPNDGFTYLPSIDSSQFNTDRPMYALQDSLIGEVLYRYYQLSSDPEKANYTISFSAVGENNGDYVLQPSNENYQVFKWVAPINGASQGSYAPLKKVVLPQKHRLIELGFDYEIAKLGNVVFNTAFTERVYNRFNPELSGLSGKAFTIGLQSKAYKVASLDDVILTYELSYEFLDAAFVPIQNFRSLSFNRDWGIDQQANYTLGEEHLIAAVLNVAHKNKHFTYGLKLREKLNNNWGNQQFFDFNRNGDVNIEVSAFLMQNQLRQDIITWKKVGVDLNYDRWWVNPGYRYDFEEHKISNADSIGSSFQNFEQHTVYLSKQDSTMFNFLISHQYRNDFKPFEGGFRLFEQSQLTNLSSTYRYNAYSTLAFQLTRKDILKTHDENIGEDFYQGSFNWNSSYFDHLISHNISYQTGTGRVLERSYFFQQVALGLGTHSWSDINGDGVKELEEFFEDQTSYGDKNYVKLFNFTSDFQTAFTNSFQSTVQLRMPTAWRNGSLWKSMVSRVSAQWFMKLDQKNTHQLWTDRINPFKQATTTDEILSAKKYMRGSVFVNRGANWSVNMNWLKSQRKQLLLSGFEESLRESYNFKVHFNPVSDWSISSGYERAFHNNISDFIESKNFNFQSQSIIPEIQWQHFKNYRVNVIFEYAQKSPNGVTEESFQIDKYRIDFGNKWNQGAIGMLEGHIQYIQVNSTLGDQLTPLSYELYEGLRAGENYVWNFSLRRKIIGDLHLSLSYNGRKSPSIKVRQFGSVQLTALF
ncbi:MAG: hypothetical protein ACI9C9_000790 [Marivirga sp.]